MKKYQVFGRYLILDHLVDGGMAKICRARFLSDQANKIVAIKMVRPQFSKDDSFRKMFEDELKLAFSLSHPNIAQTYDYGMIDNQLFTAMEYVDGANLKQFLDRLKQRNFVFPVSMSVYIISQVCSGLHYAHTYTDKLTGQPLNVVHRDISPHNIMLTYDGSVKVIDFGIAKSSVNSEMTQAGTIKGKLSYLAPEYLEGETLDARYDLFAVGLTLWELLCNRKLFTAKNDLAVLKLVQECNVPAPSSINPKVPKALDQIVLKALSRDRNDRYQNLDQLNRELVKFLYSNYPDFNASDLTQFSYQLFKDDIERDKRLLRQYGRVNITEYLEQSKERESKNKGFPRKKKEEFTQENEIHFDPKQENLRDLKVEPTRTSYKYKISTGEGTHSAVTKHQNIANGTSRTKVNVNTQPEKKKNGALIGGIIAAGIAIFMLYPKLNLSGNKSNKEVKSTVKVEEKKISNLYFNNFDLLMDIYINNKKQDYLSTGIKLEVDVEYKVRVSQKGYEDFQTKILLSEGGSYVDIPKLKKSRMGLLTVNGKSYSEDAIFIFQTRGKTIRKRMPIKRYRIPAGTYEATIVDPVRGVEEQVNFKIKENRTYYIP